MKVATACLGLVIGMGLFSSASAQGWNSGWYDPAHGAVHDALDHRAFHRDLEHREAHRYPMNYWQHEQLHDELDHEAFHDQLDHGAVHRSYVPYTGYAPYGGGVGYHGRRVSVWFGY